MLPLPALALSALVLASAGGAGEPAARARGAPGELVLDGEPARVRFTDGDTFRVEAGPLRGRRARLAGVNALETHAPVHRWGSWKPEELHLLARRSAAIAAAAGGRCTSAGRDRYGRLLVSCPEVARALVAAGHAMVFAVDAAPDPSLLALQRSAQEAGAGMWAAGVPPEIPTSVHSRSERGLGRRGAYDRVADTRTGVAAARPHRRAYAPCEEVCVGPWRARACLVYVPYGRRHRAAPACPARR
jgi:endonuclease YncB( thermonuclease family)